VLQKYKPKVIFKLHSVMQSFHFATFCCANADIGAGVFASQQRAIGFFVDDIRTSTITTVTLFDLIVFLKNLVNSMVEMILNVIHQFQKLTLLNFDLY